MELLSVSPALSEPLEDGGIHSWQPNLLHLGILRSKRRPHLEIPTRRRNHGKENIFAILVAEIHNGIPAITEEGASASPRHPSHALHLALGH